MRRAAAFDTLLHAPRRRLRVSPPQGLGAPNVSSNSNMYFYHRKSQSLHLTPHQLAAILGSSNGGSSGTGWYGSCREVWLLWAWQLGIGPCSHSPDYDAADAVCACGKLLCCSAPGASPAQPISRQDSQGVCTPRNGPTRRNAATSTCTRSRAHDARWCGRR